MLVLFMRNNYDAYLLPDRRPGCHYRIDRRDVDTKQLLEMEKVR